MADQTRPDQLGQGQKGQDRTVSCWARLDETGADETGPDRMVEARGRGQPRDTNCLNITVS